MNILNKLLKRKTPYNLKQDFKFLDGKTEKAIILDKKIKINDFSYIFRYKLTEENKILGNNIGDYVALKLFY